MSVSCKRCRFFDPESDDDGLGYCRRMAPIVDPSGYVTIFGLNRADESPYDALQGFWPKVTSDEWCGEFRSEDAP